DPARRSQSALRAPDGVRGPSRPRLLSGRPGRAAPGGSRHAAHRRGDAAYLRRIAQADRAIQLSRDGGAVDPFRAAQALPGRTRLGERTPDLRARGVTARYDV